MCGGKWTDDVSDPLSSPNTLLFSLLQLFLFGQRYCYGAESREKPRSLAPHFPHINIKPTHLHCTLSPWPSEVNGDFVHSSTVLQWKASNIHSMALNTMVTWIGIGKRSPCHINTDSTHFKFQNQYAALFRFHPEIFAKQKGNVNTLTFGRFHTNLRERLLLFLYLECLFHTQTLLFLFPQFCKIVKRININVWYLYLWTW